MENEINIKTVTIILAIIILPIVAILFINQLNKPNSKLETQRDAKDDRELSPYGHGVAWDR